MRLKKWWAIVALILFALLARAQQLPTLSYEVQVFNQVTGPTISPIPTVPSPGNVCNTPNSTCAIQNTGMGSHVVTFCLVSGTVANIALWLEGSNDGTVTAGVPTPANWQQITQQAVTLNGCGSLQGGGYFQWLRLHLATFNGTAPVLNAWYSGIGTALPGGGLLSFNQPSAPVTFNPSIAFTFTNLLSTPQTVASTALAVYSLNATNPNNVPVFVKLTCCVGGACVNSGGPVLVAVPANDSRSPQFGAPGYACPAPSSTISCSTSATSAIDPASACAVNVIGKMFNSINTQIQFNGTVSASQLQSPN